MKKLKNRITGIYEKIINELEMLHNVFTRLKKRFDLNLNVIRKHFLQFLQFYENFDYNFDIK